MRGFTKMYKWENIAEDTFRLQYGEDTIIRYKDKCMVVLPY